MLMAESVPGLRIGGKPQCHIVALAKEQGEVAASLGCTLSRTRTGQPDDEMTCAIPGVAPGRGGGEHRRLRPGSTPSPRAYAAADLERFAEI